MMETVRIQLRPWREEKCGFRDTGRQNLISHLAIGADRPVKVMQLDRPTTNHME